MWQFALSTGRRRLPVSAQRCHPTPHLPSASQTWGRLGPHASVALMRPAMPPGLDIPPKRHRAVPGTLPKPSSPGASFAPAAVLRPACPGTLRDPAGR